jgi:uncharacterized Zn-binding protein involved in type VI secretion
MPAAIRIGDPTACSDHDAGGSPNVFINGIPVGRIGDPTTGHGCWHPNSNLQGSPDVFANNIGVTRVGDLHVGHSCPDNGFHQTAYSSGSPDCFLDD